MPCFFSAADSARSEVKNRVRAMKVVMSSTKRGYRVPATIPLRMMMWGSSSSITVSANASL